MTDGSWQTTTVVCVDATPRASSADRPPVDELLRHGGRLLSDGQAVAVVAFSSASVALDAAIAVQASRPPADAVRVGIAAGDLATERSGQNEAVVFAARRLQQRAVAGQILVSGPVLALARGVLHVPHRALPNGGDEGFEVLWSGASPIVAPLPAPLAVSVSLGARFVAREREWVELDRAWNDVLLGAHRVVVISGGAGEGKTRLAAEFAAHVHRLGALVLHGACDRVLRLPYQPWGEALDALVSDPPSEVRDILASIQGDLDALWPDRVPSNEEVVDGAIDRYRTFEAVGALLEAAARSHPVVLVLDDLHWAGPRALSLLRHLARAEACPRTMIVAAYRDTPSMHGGSLAAWQADVHRFMGVVRVRLGALERHAVAELLHVTALDGFVPTERTIEAVAERSAGNPFHALELWQHVLTLAAASPDGDDTVDDLARTAVPDSLKEVLAPRLHRVAPATLRLVRLAALGGGIDLDVLRAAMSVDDGDVDRALDELVDVGVLVQSATEMRRGHSEYQFVSPLVRDVIIDATPPITRARFHLTLAELIERSHGERCHGLDAELARHYGEAAPLIGPVKAIHHARRAAADAARTGAYGDAAAHLRVALRHSEEDEDRVELLLELASMEATSGRADDGVASATSAFDLARRLDEPALLARAALTCEQIARGGVTDGAEADRLRAALTAVGHDAHALRSQLHAALATALARQGRAADARAAVDHAVVLGRHAGDDDVLASALEQAVIPALDDPDRMLALGAERDQLAVRHHDALARARAAAIRFQAEVARGDMTAAAATLERLRDLTRGGLTAGVEAMVARREALLALAAGRFADAEAALDRAEALDAGDPLSDPAPRVLGRLALRRDQGRSAEVLDQVKAVRRERREPVWVAALAAVHTDLGLVDEARRDLDDLGVRRLDTVARDGLWPLVLAFAAECVIEVGDDAQVRAVTDELLAFEGRNLTGPTAIAAGPADRLLAGLAARSGSWALAEARFRSARELADRSRAPAWRIRVDHDWARFLAGHDLARARELGMNAARAAAAIGMKAVAQRPIRTGSSRISGRWSAAAERGPLSARELDVLRLVAAGCSNREIGARLYISSNTAANHVRAILQKTGCANRAQAVAYAAQRHLLDDLV